jgi:hypothetical protein
MLAAKRAPPNPGAGAQAYTAPLPKEEAANKRSLGNKANTRLSGMKRRVRIFPAGACSLAMRDPQPRPLTPATSRLLELMKWDSRLAPAQEAFFAEL